MGFEDMTTYEQAAWRHSIGVLFAAPRRKVIPANVRDGAARVASKVSRRVGDLPGAEQSMETVERVFQGTLSLIFEPALRSSSPDATAKRYGKKHPEVRTFGDIQALPLEKRDAMMPPKSGYTALSAGQGALTALAITGAEVSTTVSGGATAAVAIGAIAADSVASLAMMGRTIGTVGTRYGYDMRLPEEELFAMGILSLGVAGSMAARAQALAALSRLTQEMMRQATRRQLSEHVLVRVIEAVYKQLGLRLTHRKLAQTVPFVGVGLNAALSSQLTHQAFRRAQAVYRLRSLSDTFDIDPDEWKDATPSYAPDAGGSSRESVVDVIEILERERAAEDRDT